MSRRPERPMRPFGLPLTPQVVALLVATLGLLFLVTVSLLGLAGRLR